MKRLLLILTLACFAISGWAEQITREQALRQAQQFLSKNGKGALLTTAETSMSKARRRSQQVPDYYYVFNAGQDQGYVIVSGDDRTEPILGYSYHGTFDVDKIPCNMAAWLQGYADQIKYIQEHNIQPSQKQNIRRSNPAISKLVTCQWDQDDPFNTKCPSVGTKKCVTGCVTTAVSQILYYHAKNGYTPSCTDIPGYTTESRGDVIPALSGTSFDWGNMIDFYDNSATSEQKAAVAKLFQYVGTGLKAEYDLSENGGTLVWDNMPEIVFKNYFGYGNGIQLIRRTDAIPESEWDNLIYNELANGRPVLYSGQSSGGSGHSFVIDGYDGTGKYAINWGWGGYQDNYFALSALNPELGGAGAGTGGYNYNQTALVGISSNNVDIYSITVEETPVLSAVGICVADPSVDLGVDGINPADYTEYTGTRDAGGNVNYSFRFSYGLNLYNSYTFNVGFVLMKDGAVVGTYNNFGNATLGGNWSFFFRGTLNIGSGLANGNYQLKLAYKLASDSEWKLCVDADSHILNVRVTDTSITLKVGGFSPTPEVTQAELDELAALYAAQKKAINDKMAILSSNETSLAAIAQTLKEKKKAIDAAADKIKALKDKLTSKYLTTQQQSSYATELQAIEDKLKTLQSEYDAAQKEQVALQTKGDALANEFKALLATVNTELAAVASITTKAALDASKAKAADVEKQQTSYSALAEAAEVATLETKVSGLSVADIETSLASLDSKVEADIAAAKKAEEDAKDKEAKEKELAEVKNELSKNYILLERQVDDIIAEMVKCEKTIASLETDIKNAQAAIDPVEKKIAEIKESLKSDMLTAEQKASFLTQLDALAKAKENYVAAMKAHQDHLDVIKKLVADAKAALNVAKADILTQKDKVAALTIDDDLAAAKTAYKTIEYNVEGISSKSYESDLAVIKEDLDKLLLESTTKELAALEEEVEKAIAGGKEAYEKQQAEKLAKAKEAFEAAVAALEEAIQSQEANYENRLNVVSTLKATLVELDDAISQMKAKCAEIEKKLQELIDKQSTTRADDSEVIEELKKKLAKLKADIATLESQREVIPGKIDQLDQQIKAYAAVIEEAKTTKQKLQADLSSATTADEVEKLSASVANAKSELASEGLDWYNTLVYNCNIVVEYVSGFTDNVNIVEKETQVLEKAVEETVTAINQLIIDESKVVARYDMKGNPVDSTYKGVQIIRLKNGKTIKLNVK